MSVKTVWLAVKSLQIISKKRCLGLATLEGSFSQPFHHFPLKKAGSYVTKSYSLGIQETENATK